MPYIKIAQHNYQKKLSTLLHNLLENKWSTEIDVFIIFSYIICSSTKNFLKKKKLVLCFCIISQNSTVL